MGSSIFSLLLIPILLCIFFLLGFSFTSRMEKELSVMYTIIIGFFVYFGIFQVVALPMKILLMPLSTLSIVWLVVLALLIVVSVILNRSKWGLILKKKPDRLCWIIMGIFMVVVLAEVVLITNNIRYGSFLDASYYIADSGRSVATNTIEQYDQYTGKLRTELAPLYLILTYTAHNSVLSYVTGIHSLVIWRQVMGAIVIILANFIIYQTSFHLLKRKPPYALAAWGLWLLVQFFSYSTYTTSGFMFYRAFEGKTILAVVILPAAFLCMVRSISSGFSEKDFIAALLVDVGAIPFCMSSMMLLPVLFTIFFIPGMIAYRKPKAIGQWLVLNAICLLEIVCYLLISHGVWRVVIQ